MHFSLRAYVLAHILESSISWPTTYIHEYGNRMRPRRVQYRKKWWIVSEYMASAIFSKIIGVKIDFLVIIRVINGARSKLT